MAANVDASRVIDELEATLHHGEQDRRYEAMAILRRWQWDRELDEGSRRRAGSLVRAFAWRV